MRIDHHAYQRATRVAGVGFMAQAAIGLTLLIFSRISDDTAFFFSSLYVLLGTLVWLGLVIVFHQHRLERLEALEEDELASRGAGGGSVFEERPEEARVAAKRLELMHRWLLPVLSLVLALAQSLLGWLMLRALLAIRRGDGEFILTPSMGWAVAICLAFSALAFIISRFVAGMAKQAVWQNLRGGASAMVGNALVTLAVAVGIGFRFFKNDEVIQAIALALPFLMFALSAEIVLNFVLNLYRPRIPGETPRAAFDSRVLSMLAAPDSLVRSINEAVNYQFGFDVTSSWGYQLLLRSFASLVALGAAVAIFLNAMVLVEPHQQAVRLARGAIVGDQAHGSGILWKLPWPLETAETHAVTALRELSLTGRQVVEKGAELWTDELGQKFDRPLEPFLVSAAHGLPWTGASGGAPGEEPAAAALSQAFSLIDAEIVLRYRVRATDNGLLDYLAFSTDFIPRRQKLSIREQALRALAVRAATQSFARLSVDSVLGRGRAELSEELRRDIQREFDERKTGVEIVAVDLLLVRPAGEAAASFEELNVSRQGRQQLVAAAQQIVTEGYANLVGDPARIPQILEAIDEWDALRAGHGAESAETIVQRDRVTEMLVAAGGAAGLAILGAEGDRSSRIADARTQSIRVAGQAAPYSASPALYRQREVMNLYAAFLPGMRKFVIGIDPTRMHVDLELKELNPLFNIADALKKEEPKPGESGQ